METVFWGSTGLHPESLGEVLSEVPFYVAAPRSTFDENITSGADIVGMEDLAEQVKKGELNFDVVVASRTFEDSNPSGKTVFGKPNNRPLALARRLGVPFRSGGGLCGSKVADAQAAYEAANTLQTSASWRRRRSRLLTRWKKHTNGG